MKTHVFTRESAIMAIKKAIADKNVVREYLKGNISKEELDKKGIKLGRPI
ncbi:TPA: hypothetical protein ACGZ9U_003703 [Elizabethkingia anophelis]